MVFSLGPVSWPINCFQHLHPDREIGCQPLHPDTDALLHDESNLHLESYRRSVTVGMQSPCPVDVGSISSEVDHSCEEN